MSADSVEWTPQKKAFSFPGYEQGMKNKNKILPAEKNKQQSKKKSLPYYHQVFGNNNYRGFHITIQISNGTTEPKTASYPSLNNEHRKHENDAAREM